MYSYASHLYFLKYLKSFNLIQHHPSQSAHSSPLLSFSLPSHLPKTVHVLYMYNNVVSFSHLYSLQSKVHNTMYMIKSPYQSIYFHCLCVSLSLNFSLSLDLTPHYYLHFLPLSLTTLVLSWNISGAIHPSVPSTPDWAVNEPRPWGSLRHRPKSEMRALTLQAEEEKKTLRRTFCGFMSLCTEREKS